MAIFAIGLAVSLWGSMLAWVVWCGITAPEFRSQPWNPQKEFDVIDEIEGIILAATRCREFQEARAERMLKIHGYKYGTCEADLLASVIYDGMAYTEAMESIMRLKRNRKPNDAAAIEAEEDATDGFK